MTDSRWLFLKEFFLSYETTGAIAPSGRALARAMAAPLETLEENRRILEAGPGTGVFSNEVIRLLRPGDELVLCEINEKFARVLQQRLETDPTWSAKKEQIRVECEDIRKFLLPSSWDFIVSGLPLTNFTAEFVDELLSGFVQSLTPGGLHTFFEYLWIRDVRRRVGTRTTRDRMQANHERVERLGLEGKVTEKKVFLNAPPAIVYEFKSRK